MIGSSSLGLPSELLGSLSSSSWLEGSDTENDTVRSAVASALAMYKPMNAEGRKGVAISLSMDSDEGGVAVSLPMDIERGMTVLFHGTTSSQEGHYLSHDATSSQKDHCSISHDTSFHNKVVAMEKEEEPKLMQEMDEWSRYNPSGLQSMLNHSSLAFPEQHSKSTAPPTPGGLSLGESSESLDVSMD